MQIKMRDIPWSEVKEHFNKATTLVIEGEKQFWACEICAEIGD